MKFLNVIFIDFGWKKETIFLAMCNYNSPLWLVRNAHIFKKVNLPFVFMSSHRCFPVFQITVSSSIKKERKDIDRGAEQLFHINGGS